MFHEIAKISQTFFNHQLTSLSPFVRLAVIKFIEGVGHPPHLCFFLSKLFFSADYVRFFTIFNNSLIFLSWWSNSNCGPPQCSAVMKTTRPPRSLWFFVFKININSTQINIIKSHFYTHLSFIMCIIILNACIFK